MVHPTDIWSYSQNLPLDVDAIPENNIPLDFTRLGGRCISGMGRRFLHKLNGDFPVTHLAGWVLVSSMMT